MKSLNKSRSSVNVLDCIISVLAAFAAQMQVEKNFHLYKEEVRRTYHERN